MFFCRCPPTLVQASGYHVASQRIRSQRPAMLPFIKFTVHLSRPSTQHLPSGQTRLCTLQDVPSTYGMYLQTSAYMYIHVRHWNAARASKAGRCGPRRLVTFIYCAVLVRAQTERCASCTGCTRLPHSPYVTLPTQTCPFELVTSACNSEMQQAARFLPPNTQQLLLAMCTRHEHPGNLPGSHS